MFSSNGVSSAKKQRPVTTGYLARPKLGALRSTLYPSKSFKPTTGYGYEKRKKARKSHDSKMDFRKRPDYADTAYREAVSRLRLLLADSYTPMKRPLRDLDSAGEETDNQSLLSGVSRTSRPSHIHYRYSPSIPRRYPYYNPTRTPLTVSHLDSEKTVMDSKWEAAPKPPELMSFIERQEEYIEQLENESKLCRGELTSLLRKVKDVISENEDLHDKQKSSLIKSVFHTIETETETETETDIKKMHILRSPKRTTRKHIHLEGPSIVFESRISELEAQLTQNKIELKKALDENDAFKRKIADGSLADGLGLDSHKKHTESLQKEKNLLQDTVNKLQNALVQLRDKENITTDQIKRSLDTAEQAQYEKNSAENEVRRVKDELERQHGKLRDVINEQGRRLADERSAIERRYSQQIEQLTTELGVQWEATSKVQMELDKQRRENADLRRELAQKQAYIDELKKETQSKIATMQSDIGVTGAEKSVLEQQIATLQLANERNERQARQDANRLQAELQSLRQRLDRSDADLIHSRRENIRLNEQIASLEKEINLSTALSDERAKRGIGNEIVALPPPSNLGKENQEKDLSGIVKNMENKHAATVAELESMINSQNQLMDKLTGECHELTVKLEDASNRHKEEIRELQVNLDYLSSRVNLTQSNNKLPTQYKDEEYNKPSTQWTAQPTPVPTPKLAAGQSRNSFERPMSRTSSNASIKPNSPPRRKPSIGQNKVIKGKPPIAPNTQYLPNQQYSTESNPQYLTDPNQQYSTDPNQQYLTNPNQQYSTDPNQQYLTDPNQQYATDPNQQYLTDPNQQYVTDPNQAYSTDPSQYSEDPNQQYLNDPNQQYTTDPNQQYLDDPNQQYVTDPNQQYATDPNQQYATDPNQQYATDPSQQYATDPNQQYLTNPNQQYSTDPNQKYLDDPSQQYSTDPNQQYGAPDPNPNQQYAGDPNSQYLTDPNQQYATDPNQQYTTDPNQQYATDPNQQYATNPNVQYANDSNRQYATDPKYQSAPDPKPPSVSDRKPPSASDPKPPSASDPKPPSASDPKVQNASDPKSASNVNNQQSMEQSEYDAQKTKKDLNPQQYQKDPKLKPATQPSPPSKTPTGQNKSKLQRKPSTKDPRKP